MVESMDALLDSLNNLVIDICLVSVLQPNTGRHPAARRSDLPSTSFVLHQFSSTLFGFPNVRDDIIPAQPRHNQPSGAWLTENGEGRPFGALRNCFMVACSEDAVTYQQVATTRLWKSPEIEISAYSSILKLYGCYAPRELNHRAYIVARTRSRSTVLRHRE